MSSVKLRMFSGLQQLESRQAEIPICKVCSGHATLFDAVDFNKHCSGLPYQFGLSGIVVPYYRCTKCSFIFSDFIDDWSVEEVSQFIYNDDYVKVDPEYIGVRARRTARLMTSLLAGCEDLRILDYGSGSGVFSEEMATHGFKRVENYDPFSSPLRPAGPFDLITCFEVIEHSPRPLTTLIEMCDGLSNQGAIIIGQSLQPNNIEEIGARWWYVAPRNGHVSIFAEETFLTLANRLNLIYRRGSGIYAFTRDRLAGPTLSAVERIGLPIHEQILAAPHASVSDSEWHGMEVMETGLFRWSAEANLHWANLDFRAGVTMIQIPFVMEICDGFAKKCTILVDGKEVSTRVERHRIIGEITSVHAATCDVALLTPQPVTPLELRGAPDTRRLGLALTCR
jgi:hypothetical protein